ncbi:type II secretion system F family protein [Candidatus Micrarchaeota archaeon]|nr:type II secretion system F family protein [Candidatus Micrarchaeota archaeon]
MDIIEFSKRFPQIHYSNTKLKKQLELLNGDIESYTTFSLILSFVFSILIMLSLIPFDFVFSFFAFILSFLLLVLFFLRFPSILLDEKEKTMEAELPYFLKTLHMLLELRIPFPRTLGLISKEEGMLPSLLKKAVREIKKGMALDTSLLSMLKGIKSLQIKRAIAQVVTAYRYGREDNIKRISEDLLNIRKYKLKEFASKQAMFGLLFIAISTLLPAIVLIFTTVGGIAFQMKFPPIAFIFLYFIGFPLISVILLLFMKSCEPKEVLQNDFSRFPLLLTILLALLLILFSFLNLPSFWMTIIIILGVLLVLGLSYKEYLEIKRLEKIENQLPDALLSAAQSPKGKTLESILIPMLSSGEELKEELEISLKQLKSHVKQSKVLVSLGKRTGKMGERICLFIEEVLSSGADTSRYMTSISEDILSLFQIKRERSNLLAMQKYTLLAGGFILPAVLALSLSLILKISSLMEINNEIANLAPSVIPTYLIIYSVLVSYYISESEAKPSNSVIYFGVLSVSAMVIFTIVKGFF